MRSVRAVKKTLISVVNRHKRIAFCRKFCNFNFNKVIFSDEKMFRVRPGGNLRCWKMITSDKYEGRYTMPTVKKAEGLMVWAAMKSDGSICLRRCPKKVNAQAYQTILLSAKQFIRPRFVHKGAGKVVVVRICVQVLRMEVPTRRGQCSPSPHHPGLPHQEPSTPVEEWLLATDVT